MGLVHEVAGPPPADQVAHALPVLDGRDVADVIELAAAYAAVRRAVLGLSGISLMQHLGLGSPGSLAGVVVSARCSVDEARSQLGRPGASGHRALRRRATLLAGACDALDEHLLVLTRNGCSDVPRDLLESLRAVLARTSLVEAGMRQFSSVSCAKFEPDHSSEHHHHG